MSAVLADVLCPGCGDRFTFAALGLCEDCLFDVIPPTEPVFVPEQETPVATIPTPRTSWEPHQLVPVDIHDRITTLEARLERGIPLPSAVTVALIEGLRENADASHPNAALVRAALALTITVPTNA
jgi:hypothetical protein